MMIKSFHEKEAQTSDHQSIFSEHVIFLTRCLKSYFILKKIFIFHPVVPKAEMNKF